MQSVLSPICYNLPHTKATLSMPTSIVPKNLQSYNIKLASTSPRRKELMQLLGLDFEIVNTHDVEEICPQSLPVACHPEYLSILKASAYYDELAENDLLITADTMVICDGIAFGKPKNREDAISMLQTLSGHIHQVVTGVTVCTSKLHISFSVTTDVEFAHLSLQEIETYVDTCRPFDKAGAYGIQEWIGAIGISGIYGSYYNVMGLPVHYLYEVLKHFA